MANKMWLIGNRLMSKAFQFLMQHKDRSPQVADFDGFYTRFSEAMLLEHAPATVLNMINVRLHQVHQQSTVGQH